MTFMVCCNSWAARESVQPYIVPIAVTILVALFAVQSNGTARIGKMFGPIMFAWFIVMALMGLSGILQHPSVFAALDPRYVLAYLVDNRITGFLVLGGVFLCVTGAEALYADMGHFGRGPIRLSWFAIVFPSLLVNYAGQAALVLEGVPTNDNIFYQLCPQTLLIPLVGLATVATIIASQSIITGAFSMTRQEILPVPWLAPDKRITIQQVAPDIWRAQARFGFLERPNIPELLTAAKTLGCEINLDDITYVVGHETVVHREDGNGLPRWQEALFAMMERNATHVSDFFSMPSDQVVEIGRQVTI